MELIFCNTGLVKNFYEVNTRYANAKFVPNYLEPVRIEAKFLIWFLVFFKRKIMNDLTLLTR